MFPRLHELSGWLPPGKVFLVLLIATYATGVYLLALAAFGGPTWLAFVPLMFAYNSDLIAGFINYDAGVAMYLLAFGCWLLWKDSWTLVRALAFAGLALACYLAHMTSIGFLGVSILTVSAYELYKKRTLWWGLAVTALGLLPVVMLYLIYAFGSAQIKAPIEWNSIKGKLIQLLVVIRTYDVRVDLALMAGIAICLAFLFVRSKRKFTVSVPILLCSCVLMLGYLVAPYQMFTGSPVDGRFVWPAFVLFTLAFRPHIRPRDGAICLIAFLLLFLVRADIMWSHWRELDVKISRMVRVFDQLPRDSKLYVAYYSGPGVDATKRDEAVRHVPCYAVVARDAYVPTVHGIRGMQPIVDKHIVAFRQWLPGTALPWSGYDYVWTYKPPPDLTDILLRTATRATSVDDSTLWRINQPLD